MRKYLLGCVFIFVILGLTSCGISYKTTANDGAKNKDTTTQNVKNNQMTASSLVSGQTIIMTK